MGEKTEAKKTAPAEFTLDGEAVDIAAFVADNEFDVSEAARILALKPGESINYGGGAGADFVLRREAA